MKNYGLNLEKEKADRSIEDNIFGAESLPCITNITMAIRGFYLPIGEVQFGAEDMMDCATRGPINYLETKFNWLLRNNKFKNRKWLEDNEYIIDNHIEFSDAFVAINSGTTKNGNSMKAPLQSIHDKGLIPKKMLPLEKWMRFDDYHNPNRITEKMRKLGEDFAKIFHIRYEIVYEKDYPTLIENDMINVAGYAWLSPVNGIYLRNDLQPNHVFLAFQPRYYIFDNYLDYDGDYVKILSPNYNFLDYGYRIFIVAENSLETETQKINIMTRMISLLQQLVETYKTLIYKIQYGWRDRMRGITANRSPQWPVVRFKHLETYPRCSVCGKGQRMLKPLECHHCVPFSVDKSLELSEDNLISLCRADHLLFGHLNFWKSWNKDVRKNCEEFAEKIKNRP